jgi:hypothetical protein
MGWVGRFGSALESKMWDWFAKYPALRIEDVGMPVIKNLEVNDLAKFDYIIVGGTPVQSPLQP